MSTQDKLSMQKGLMSINSLKEVDKDLIEKKIQTDDYKWIDTNPEVKSNHVFKKYSLMSFLFVCGLLLVLVVKNETRNLEKTISELKATNNLLKFDLDQVILDNEVITSPENISLLAKKHLDDDLISYRKSQIKSLNDENEIFSELIRKNENGAKEIKYKVAKKIVEKKKELQKLQELYNKPEKIPGTIKTQVAKKIVKKKEEIKNLYESPKEVVTITRATRWAAIQVVKLFMGIPIVPGR